MRPATVARPAGPAPITMADVALLGIAPVNY
jgi:hypothetical protein